MKPVNSAAGPGQAPLGRLEALLIGLALLLGLVLRLFHWGAPFDRQFDGFQGSFFAVCAVNYERLGFSALAGYPVANIDPTLGDRTSYYAYANHPPLVPWLSWAALKLGAPAGWENAWREQRAPEGIEGPLRTPFLAFQLLGWLGLYAALRWGLSPRAAAYAAAIYGLLPVTWLYAGLVNYENPSLGALLVALAALARRRAGAGAAWLWLAAGAALLAALTTFAPVFFLPGIGLWCWLGRGRRGFLEGSLIAAAMLSAVVLHGFFSARALALIGAAPDSLAARAQLLLSPLFDGSLPLSRWLAIQARSAWQYFGPGPLFLASLGLILAALGLGQRSTQRSGAGLVLLLALGGSLVLLGFYRHTGDPQEPFLLNLAPGIAALGGYFLCAWPLRSTASPLPAGMAPTMTAPEQSGAPQRAHGAHFAALALCLALASTAPAALSLQRDWRSPERPGPRETGSELGQLLPPGSLGWYPAGLGFNNAVFFYAWRTLLPVGPESYGLAQEQQKRFGMQSAPLYLVMPKEPSPAAAASCARVAQDLEERRPGQLARPDLESANYRAFRLN